MNGEKKVVIIGETEEKKSIGFDFQKNPHLLICGIVGVGKTSLIQSIICDLLSQDEWKESRFVVYENRGIDYKQFSDCLKKRFQVTSDCNKFKDNISSIVNMIKRRIDLMAQEGCKDYSDYKNKTDRKMYPVFLVLDDYHIFMSMNENKSILDFILLNGRITGVYIIISMLITDKKKHIRDLIIDFPCRVCFNVNSKEISKMVLDKYGAECLSVSGEIYFKKNADIYKLKSAHKNDEDINAFLEMFKKSISPEDKYETLEENKYVYTEELDEYFEEAARFVIEKQKASTSMLQRVFRIGFNRAARIMDQLSEAGIIGPEEGTSPRKVVMTIEEFEILLDSNQVL